MAAVAAASAELLIIGWYIFRVLLQGGSWVSRRRCSGTPCRSWHTRCRGPGGRCWGSAGSEPPTEAPAPSPGRPYHQVLLCISASTGASAAQECGVPCVPSPEEHLARSVRGQ
ncbi:neuronatin [Homo sapiens]|uniref:Neuronatin n=1 Tax=Homo sapiens TaxID=9606 RepID=A0A3B3IS74_HUMAN|nr:neuronatin, isoform CRA_a [Homo sapiens]KAI2594784.1 neuronatin [Homo sapiens]KAI4005493.1 neuronatin [Homo sapiens]